MKQKTKDNNPNLKLRRKPMSLTTKSAWTAQVFILPFYIGFLFFFLSPVIESIRMSLSNTSIDINTTGYQLEWVGFANYHEAYFVDANFTTNLTNTLTNMLWQVPVIIVLSLFMALIINQKFRGRVLIRAVFFIPVIFASGMALNLIQADSVAGSALMGNMVAGGEITSSSALRELLVSAGFNNQIINIATSISNSLFQMVWKSGIQMIIFLAGLQSIPPTLYEASSIEGATSWENFWKITFPMLAPTILINIVYTVVDMFTDTNNLIMRSITDMMANSISKLGLASAFAWTYFAVIGLVLLIVFVIFYFVNKKIS